MTTPVYKGWHFAWVRGINSLTPMKLNDILPSIAKKVVWKTPLSPTEEGKTLEQLINKYPITLAMKETGRGTHN